ncbi:MAG: S41 family peptidase [Niabella sp.]
MNNKRFQVWLPLVLALVMAAGMFLGYKFTTSLPNGGVYKNGRIAPLQEAMDLIKKRYVDSLGMDTIQANAIRMMVDELDPHSVYLPPADLKETTEDLAGNFEGIGVEFNQVRDTVNIVYVIKDGPSDKAGLQIGDQIIAVNDSSLVGKEMTTVKIRSLIRGEKGSKAVLKIMRNGKPLNVTVTRGSIPTPSISAAYMIDGQTGYIKLDKFTGTSYREFMQALENLQAKGMKELIFDLRNNGGGFMEQAVEIADEFLDGDKLIVYTQGQNSPKEEYRCKRPGLFEKGKLVVLIDELSASASEIVSGALQDWDRATIVGRRSFGKGLVQQVYPLSDGSAIKLTVARYYTPLGRSIQKSYTSGKKVYMDEVWSRFANGEAFVADSNKVSNGKAYKTPGGRTLYGSGGIMPDVFVGLDTSKAFRHVNRMFFNGNFNDFVFHYYLDHKTILTPFATPDAYIKSFDVDKNMWSQFAQWAKKDSLNVASITPDEKQRLQERLKANLARFKWRDDGYYQVVNSKDPVVLKALDVLKK